MDEVSDGAELWRLITEHSPVGMALVGLDGRWLICNRALSDMLGYSPEDLTQGNFQAITHPEDLDEDLGQLSRILGGEIDSYRLVKRYLHAQGRVVWGDLSVAVVRRADGTPRHFISQILDVTEQRENEEHLAAAGEEAERERRTLEAIFETVGVGLLLINREGRYERMNQRHAETMRVPFPDGHAGRAGQLGLVYRPDGETLMSTEEMPSYRATQGEEFNDLTFWVGDDPLTHMAYSVSARQIRDPSGERIGAVLAYKDITDLMRAIQAKDQFLASVSHELRTPLTSVLGHLELLGERPDIPEDVIGQLGVVRRNATRLRALVSDLLQVAQAQEGNLVLQREPVDLVTLVGEVVESSRSQAETQQVILEIDAPERLVAEVDGQRLRQVLDNLVSNAVKYTPTGGTVRVILRSTSAGVELDVADTGIGIASDEVDRVFSRFFRGTGAVDRHIPGTGLGLNIAASIIRAHGGTIELESELGHGSTFRVALATGSETDEG